MLEQANRRSLGAKIGELALMLVVFALLFILLMMLGGQQFAWIGIGLVVNVAFFLIDW